MKKQATYWKAGSAIHIINKGHTSVTQRGLSTHWEKLSPHQNTWNQLGWAAQMMHIETDNEQTNAVHSAL